MWSTGASAQTKNVCSIARVFLRHLLNILVWGYQNTRISRAQEDELISDTRKKSDVAFQYDAVAEFLASNLVAELLRPWLCVLSYYFPLRNGLPSGTGGTKRSRVLDLRCNSCQSMAIDRCSTVRDPTKSFCQTVNLTQIQQVVLQPSSLEHTVVSLMSFWERNEPVGRVPSHARSSLCRNRFLTDGDWAHFVLGPTVARMCMMSTCSFFYLGCLHTLPSNKENRNLS